MSTNVVVLGAGVIGLTIALELHKNGFRPAIVARDLPTDSSSTDFASPWAGANWHSFAGATDERQLAWDAATYRRLEIMAQSHPELVKRHEFVDIYDQPVPVKSVAWRQVAKNFRLVKATRSNPLPGNAPYAHIFDSFTLNAPKYIQHLADSVKQLGIPIIRRQCTALDEAYHIADIGPVDLVINATGLGAKVLAGVMDDKVYPARGQTLLVNAPEARKCIMRADAFANHANSSNKADPPPYIIPRPGTNGQVIIGGTYEKGIDSTLISLDQAERTLQDCYELDPNLAPSSNRKGGGCWRDIDVVSVNVGIRPCRTGGPRVEIEHRIIGQDWQPGCPSVFGESGRSVNVIHAYGFGGVGFIASVGVAEQVARMARDLYPRVSAKL